MIDDILLDLALASDVARDIILTGVVAIGALLALGIWTFFVLTVVQR